MTRGFNFISGHSLCSKSSHLSLGTFCTLVESAGGDQQFVE